MQTVDYTVDRGNTVCRPVVRSLVSEEAPFAAWLYGITEFGGQPITNHAGGGDFADEQRLMKINA